MRLPCRQMQGGVGGFPAQADWRGKNPHLVSCVWFKKKKKDVYKYMWIF